MKSGLSILNGRFAFGLASLAMVLSVGCSKQDDDCPEPESTDAQATERAFEAGPSKEEERPSGIYYRATEPGSGGAEGDGISDDGDDEADGEGNKKNRPQN